MPVDMAAEGLVLELVPLPQFREFRGRRGLRFAWGGQDDADSIATIRRSVEAGVNWIDTAAVYGLGHSEEVVAKAIHALPEADRPFVFTKAGLVCDENDRAAAPKRIMAAAGVRRELEDSLRRLNVERIDLYQVHWSDTGAALDFSAPDGVEPAVATPLEKYWQTMADLVEEGKVRAIGLSNHDVPQLGIAEAVAHVDASRPQFSLIKREAAGELAWAAAHHTAASSTSRSTPAC
ncbi:aldo/keto reductase [Nocardia niigatensis]